MSDSEFRLRNNVALDRIKEFGVFIRINATSEIYPIESIIFDIRDNTIILKVKE